MSLASAVGYCALDRRRRPLTGLELRGCWEGRSTSPALPSADAIPARAPVAGPLRGFVPVEEVVAAVPHAAARPKRGPGQPIPEVRAPERPFIEALEPPVSLFGDLER